MHWASCCCLLSSSILLRAWTSVGCEAAVQATFCTCMQIAADKLTKIAEENWSTAVRSMPKPPAFKPSIVDQIYTSELNGKQDTGPKLKRIMLLEISQYLENYLWPNFNEETATYQHVMSIILMVNEKFRENVPAWDGFSQREDALPGFFNRVVTLKAGRQLRQHEKIAYLMFAINAFQSLENSAVRARVLKLASLPLWHALSTGRLQVGARHSAVSQPQLPFALHLHVGASSQL